MEVILYNSDWAFKNGEGRVDSKQVQIEEEETNPVLWKSISKQVSRFMGYKNENEAFEN